MPFSARSKRRWQIAVPLLVLALSACASVTSPYSTQRDKTAKGAGIGAAAGAAAAILDGKREADDILAGAAIGAVVGGGIGAYMDAQEEKFARIPGTTTERVGPDTLLVRFDSDVLFEVDSAVLCSTCRDSLEESAWVLNQYPKTAVVVQGHTDSTGTEEHNQELSERRAGAVRNFLVGRGVDAHRIATVGYGEGSPVASNDTPNGRRLNRRVDLMLRAKAR
ncbi:MAG: OmpA family protein [Acidobacteria bacterium]|nr:OmpA family protein [Acidobacteriota bacterium]